MVTQGRGDDHIDTVREGGYSQLHTEERIHSDTGGRGFTVAQGGEGSRWQRVERMHGGTGGTEFTVTQGERRDIYGGIEGEEDSQ